MTELVYLSEPTRYTLTANLLGCQKVEAGYAAILDRTICFPRGGGQPCEAASLAGQPVLDCYEEGGRVLHIVAQPLEPGPVDVRIDAAQRQCHMEQHLGEHILSRVIANRFGGQISILRIEQDSAHIEIDRALTPQQLLEAQLEVNAIIARDLPVRSIITTPQEAETRYGIPAAKAEAHATVRIVEIEGFDRNPCGGTHCATTGAVGQLVICGVKAVRGQFRIYYKCGQRAADEHNARLLTLLNLQQAFGAELLPELEHKALAALDRKNTLEAEAPQLKERLLELEINHTLATAQRIGELCFDSRILEQGDAKQVKALCDGLTARADALLLYAVKAGDGLSLIFARSKSRQAEPNLGAELRQLAAAHGGKGGGSAILAQGMMPDTAESRADFLALAGRLAGQR